MEESESVLAPIKQGKKFLKVCEAVRASNSVLVLGEAGTGKNDFAKALFSEMLDEFNTAISRSEALRDRDLQGFSQEIL